MTEARILVVDDDPNILEVLQTRLDSHGYSVATARDGNEALEHLSAQTADLLITDLKMPGMDGIELLERLRARSNDLPTIFLTAHGSIPDAVKAIKLGAHDFLVKPYSGHDLMEMIGRILDRAPVAEATRPTADDGEALLGESAAMRRVHDRIARAAAANSNVLITGESGTGKELAARLLHKCGPRAAAPFVVIDCGALQDTLLESELFGHRKGSFTSATHSKKGLLEVADGGTAFLDEIGNVSRSLQMRLLRFLQNGELRRVGDVSPRRVDVRVLAATNRNLVEATTAGEFREDLYYRLKVVTIQMPPLRRRREDVPLLADHFVRDASRRSGRSVEAIDDEAMELLVQHSWPGNVRELKHVIDAAVALSSAETLRARDLLDADFHPGDEPDSASSNLSPLARQEKEQIVTALQENDWVQKRAAEVLGISGRVIHYKIRKYGIKIPGS